MTEAPPPGTILLGKYRVERELGSGGMGVVLEATHVALGQTVAIKLLNAELARSPDVVARFLREARIAANLPSEHIARASDVGQTETGAPYLVMERLFGHDLEAEMAQRHRFPVAEAVDLVLEACEGVAEAHAHGLVHRDLKPANLFLAERPLRPRILKVLDFGLSKEADEKASLTGTEAVFGTPQYMSPEQIQSAKNVDARSDQHALGMILYEMLAGEPAYKAESVTQLIVVIATQPPPRVRVLRPDVPRALEEAIVRALAKRAVERFGDLAGFAAAIAPFGGADARARAELVRGALAKGGILGETSAPRPSRVPTDQALTVPNLPRAPAVTHAGMTSSVNAFGRASRQRSKVAAIFAVGAAALVGIIIAIAASSSGDGTTTQTSNEPSSSPAARPPDVTPVQAAPTAPTIAPTASASATAATADATSKKAKAPQTTKTAPTTKNSTLKTYVEQISGKRK
jgi:eukaryotic-like serine/threonine-protein kinase